LCSVGMEMKNPEPVAVDRRYCPVGATSCVSNLRCDQVLLPWCRVLLPSGRVLLPGGRVLLPSDLQLNPRSIAPSPARAAPSLRAYRSAVPFTTFPERLLLGLTKPAHVYAGPPERLQLGLADRISTGGRSGRV
jgi:hypothetical protein